MNVYTDKHFNYGVTRLIIKKVKQEGLLRLVSVDGRSQEKPDNLVTFKP